MSAPVFPPAIYMFSPIRFLHARVSMHTECVGFLCGHGCWLLERNCFLRAVFVALVVSLHSVARLTACVNSGEDRSLVEKQRLLRSSQNTEEWICFRTGVRTVIATSFDI